MKSTTKHIILSTLLCILTLAVFLGFYSKLPQSVPVHFDSAGNPNSFWSRNALVFGGPAAFSVINLIVAFRLKAQEGKSFLYYITPVAYTFNGQLSFLATCYHLFFPRLLG